MTSSTRPNTVPTAPAYVTSTDRFMSDWGLCQNRTNKVVVPVYGSLQRDIVLRYVQSRSDQAYVYERSTKPRYSADRYLTSIIPQWLFNGYEYTNNHPSPEHFNGLENLDDDNFYCLLECATRYYSCNLDYDIDTLHENTVPYETFYDETISAVYLGSILNIMPSGKYYMPWTSNQTNADILLDTAYHEALESLLSDNGLFLFSGDGDPCDLYVGGFDDIDNYD